MNPTDILVRRRPRTAAAGEARTARWTKIRRWLPLVAWVALIFGVSSIPQLSSEDIGLPRGFDKVVHFGEYLVLAVLFRHGLLGGAEQREAPIVLLVLATGLLIAGLDELYQSLIPGRHMSVYDFAADAAGLLAGILVGMRIERPAGRGAEQA